MEEPTWQRPLLVRYPSSHMGLVDSKVSCSKREMRERRFEPTAAFKREIHVRIVSLSGRTILVKVRHDCLVRDLKILIASSTEDMPVRRQRLYFRGEPLRKPNGSLRSNGIVGERATLYLVKRILTDRAEILELPKSMQVNREVDESSESFRCGVCGSRLREMVLHDHLCNDCGMRGTRFRCQNSACDYDICNECWIWAASIFSRQRSNILAIWGFEIGRGSSASFQPFFAEDSRYLEFAYYRHTYSRGRVEMLRTVAPPHSFKLRVGTTQVYQIDIRNDRVQGRLFELLCGRPFY